VSEGETPTPSPLSPTAGVGEPNDPGVMSLINECNHLHIENAHLRDLVCWLRGQFEGMQHGLPGGAAVFFARKEMEDAWDIVIQQDLKQQGEAVAQD